jgi:glycosyltransferase involved in cell wall biosynthesis
MHVVFFIKSFNSTYTGGIQTHVSELGQKLIQQGHQVTIITAANLFKKKRVYMHRNMRIVEVGYIPLKLGIHILPVDEFTFNFFALRKVKQMLAAGEKFDILHIQGRSGYLVDELKASIPVVATMHGLIKVENRGILEGGVSWKKRLEMKIEERYANRIEKRIIRNADAIIAVSNYMKRTLVNHFGPRETYHVIYNGIDCNKFSPDESKRKPNIILSVARLDPRKGIHFLIDAIHELHREFPQLKVRIVGKGHQETELRKRIEHYGLSDSVKLVGQKQQDEIIEEYQTADLFVLPSLEESQGIVFMEAMACGTPVVAYNIPGVDEVVEHQVDGLLVEKGDVKALTRAIRTVMMDESLRKRLGEQGRKNMVQKFDWKIIAKQTSQLYQQLISLRRK